MNTKSALIIAVAIVIGFSIEPILDRVDFSDPINEVVYVEDKNGNKFYTLAGWLNWEVVRGEIHATGQGYQGEIHPLNQYSAEIGRQLAED